MATVVTHHEPAAAGREAPKKQRLIDRIFNWRFPEHAREVVTWISVVLLLVAFALLVWGMVSAISYTLTNTGPPCTNPPQREANPPQLVVVGVCLLAFVLGHLTARWQSIDPKHDQRHQSLRQADHPETDPRTREALIIQTLLLIFLLEVIGLLPEQKPAVSVLRRTCGRSPITSAAPTTRQGCNRWRQGPRSCS